MAKRYALIFVMLATLCLVGIVVLQLRLVAKSAQVCDPNLLIQEALQVAGGIKDPYECSRAFYEISDELVKAGRKEQAKDVLTKAFDAAIDVREAYWRSRIISSVAARVAKIGMKEKALDYFRQGMESAKSIPEETGRVWTQHDIVLQMAKVGFFDEAVKAAKEIKDAWVRSVTINDIVEGAMLKVGAFEQALKVAKSIEELCWRSRALVNVAAWVAKAGQKDKAINIWEQVLQLSKGLDEWWRGVILREIALGMAKVGLFDRAVRMASGIKDDKYLAWTYGDIVIEMAKSGRKKQAYSLSNLALRTAISIKQENYRSTALSGVAFSLADAGFYDLALCAAKAAYDEPVVRVKIVKNLVKENRFEEALRIARLIDNVSLRLSALGAVAVKMAESGMRQQSSQVLDEIKIKKGSIIDAISVVKALHKIAEKVAKAGIKERAKEIFDYALQVAQGIKPEPWSSFAERSCPDLFVIAPVISTMADVGFIDEALEACKKLAESKSLPSREAYPQVLHHISVKLAETGQIERALELARGINQPYHKAVSLAAIARVLLNAKTAHNRTK